MLGKKSYLHLELAPERHADKGYGTKKCSKCVKFKIADGRRFENL